MTGVQTCALPICEDFPEFVFPVNIACMSDFFIPVEVVFPVFFAFFIWSSSFFLLVVRDRKSVV